VGVHVCVDVCNICYIRCKHTHAHIEFPMHISTCHTCFRQHHFRHCSSTPLLALSLKSLLSCFRPLSLVYTRPLFSCCFYTFLGSFSSFARSLLLSRVLSRMHMHMHIRMHTQMHMYTQTHTHMHISVASHASGAQQNTHAHPTPAGTRTNSQSTHTHTFIVLSQDPDTQQPRSFCQHTALTALLCSPITCVGVCVACEQIIGLVMSILA